MNQDDELTRQISDLVDIDTYEDEYTEPEVEEPEYEHADDTPIYLVELVYRDKRATLGVFDDKAKMELALAEHGSEAVTGIITHTCLNAIINTCIEERVVTQA